MIPNLSQEVARARIGDADGNNTSKSGESIQSRTALNAGETENFVLGTQRYARHSEFQNKFETKKSVQRRKRSARMLQQCAEQSQSLHLYCNMVQIARLIFCRPWIPDDGNKPMMDLAQSLQIWYVHTQIWCEHAAASICAEGGVDGCKEVCVVFEYLTRNRNSCQ